ncbi:MAG: heme exporter protein CcmB [Flavobacteriales bacterium]|nr:heme exporter protein CcmB [Flavobacteriales bacterium]
MRPAEILHLLRLELRLDLHQRHAVGGSLLYVVSAVFVAYQAMQGRAEGTAWNALFWIILLFAAFNTLARSFQREDAGQHLYLYTLADPRNVILARVIYGAGTMLALSLLSFAMYVLFLGHAPMDGGNALQYLIAVMAGGTGFAAVLTLVSAIASRAGNGVGLMAVLGFPIVLPLLLSAIKAGHLALIGMPWSVTGKYLLWLGVIDVIAVALAWVLFPYLWRDR